MTPVKRISDKRRASGVVLGHNSTIARKSSTRKAKGKRPRKPRTLKAIMAAAEKALRKEEWREDRFAQQFGSSERVEWMQSLPSIFSGRRPCVNMHVKGGGVARKADYQWIVPATFVEHDESHHGQKTFARKHGVDLELAATQIEALWSGTMKCPRCGHPVMRTPTPRGEFACSDFLDCGWGIKWSQIGRQFPA